MHHSLLTIARIGAVHIEHCTSCDVLHVSIGPFTMRLELGAAQQLRAALGEAFERMDTKPVAAAPSPIATVRN